ncbi:DUF2145 domain-containing protein [Roseateles noduli]|uniref:DUF2145 domain-containing protein n=1 Tax=Roseateles noduli TaxID=2052484 RepID=UPI003D64DFE8
MTALAAASASQAATFCDRGGEVSATEQDRQLQVVAIARRALEASGASAALVSRSGTDLSRFHLQYSHSGIALKDSRNSPWSVRQLYYACDESQAKLYDQGLAGFLLSAGRTEPIRLSIVTLPERDGARLAARALDNRLALALLSPRYSASAYAFSTQYQNCNQWVAELMGFAWAPRDDEAPARLDGEAPARLDGAPPVEGSAPTRQQAQRWLKGLGYDPLPVVVPSHAVMFAAQFVPLIHSDDHPIDDLYAMRLKVSTPAALEAFAHRLVPDAQRVEFCAIGSTIVVRRGWEPLPADCRAADGDEVLPLAGAM